MANTKIGKYVIESLTRSMYEDSRCIFREYVQNAADQIDIAINEKLDENDYYSIQINIDERNKRIEIEDSATGVKVEDIHLLRDVACSTKKRGVQKGFRGIGRLGGLGYCSVLTFITSAKGENKKTIMRWDAARMNQIVDDEMNASEAGEVIDKCIDWSFEEEDVNKHYFKIVMEEVTDKKLLNHEEIRNYLSMVAPVDYPTSFNKFGHQIKQYMKNNNFSLDTYNIFINDEQLYKGYTTRIINKREGDYDVTDIKFFSRNNENGQCIYWGWYSISELKGQIPAYNLPYGMRLRCKNIQVGDENTCRKFFEAEGDKRFAQYFYGELNVISPDLQPDARRDYLREGELRAKFEEMVKEDFLSLKKLCKEASGIRVVVRDYNDAITGQQNIEKKKQNGFLNDLDKSESDKKIAEYQRKEEKSRKMLAQLKQKSDESNSPLNFMYRDIETALPQLSHSSTPAIQDDAKQSTFFSIEKQVETNVAKTKPVKLRTDNPLYKNFDDKQKEIINKVYNAIYLAIADENMRESLIKKIEQQITQ